MEEPQDICKLVERLLLAGRHPDYAICMEAATMIYGMVERETILTRMLSGERGQKEIWKQRAEEWRDMYYEASVQAARYAVVRSGKPLTVDIGEGKKRVIYYMGAKLEPGFGAGLDAVCDQVIEKEST